MGAVADAALEARGTVIGVMPRGPGGAEIAHRGLTELHVVEDMHERKTKMAALADGFIVCRAEQGRLKRFSNSGPGAVGHPRKTVRIPEYQRVLRSAAGDAYQ